MMKKQARLVRTPYKTTILPEYSVAKAGGQANYNRIVEYINSPNISKSLREFMRTTAPTDEQAISRKVEADLDRQINESMGSVI